MLAGACVAPSARAQRADTSSTPPTLHDVVATARRGNPEILAARLHVDSAHAERRIAHGFTNPTASVAPGVPFEYGLGTDLDVGPNRHYRIAAAAHGLAATRFNLADTERQVMFSVRSAFYDLLLADAQVGLAGEERDILAQILAADSSRLRNGDAAEADVVTAELNLARADAAVVKAEATVRSSRLALQLLMGVPRPDTSFTVRGALRFVPVDLPLDRPDSLVALAQSVRPDVRSADEQLAQSRAIREQANWLLLPIPNVGITYQPDVTYQSPGLQPTTVLGGPGSHVAFSVAVPLPLWNWYGGEREKAKAGVAAARLAASDTRRQALSSAIQAADSLRSATLLARRYEGGLLEKTRQAIEVARYAYARGAISLLALLDAIRTSQDIRTEYLTAVHDYWIAVYGLDRAVGRDLVPDEASPP
jgi:outer membrane protein, heavy metal efflux system